MNTNLFSRYHVLLMAYDWVLSIISMCVLQGRWLVWLSLGFFIKWIFHMKIVLPTSFKGANFYKREKIIFSINLNYPQLCTAALLLESMCLQISELISVKDFFIGYLEWASYGISINPSNLSPYLFIRNSTV